MKPSSEISSANSFNLNPQQDWTAGHNRYEVWKSCLPYVVKKNPRVLEIGSWEGRSAIFFLQNVCVNGGDLTCIDHFDLLRTPEGIERFEKVRHNLSLAGGNFRIIDRYSADGLFELLLEALEAHDPGFDWIYIDGSHEGDDVLLDGELAWRLARPGCIFIFDDYRWHRESEFSRHHPKRGIDAFMVLHEGEYQVLHGLLPGDYQMILLKKSPLRIGFEAPSHQWRVESHLPEEIQFAMHCSSESVQLAINTVKSIATTNLTPGVITIGSIHLKKSDKQAIETCLTADSRIKIKFLDLPSNGLADQLGCDHGKIDLLYQLVGRRAIVVDPGISIPSNIQEQWYYDLRGCPLGAFAHETFPEGHDTIRKGRYFSDEFLIVDVQKVQEKWESLGYWARRLKESRFPRQDAFNTNFEFAWKTIMLHKDSAICSRDTSLKSTPSPKLVERVAPRSV